ncbi:hypothetical protein CPC16_001607 [Podila verticillata]|nr:hypothetical protein CPC16_001607 [Podila verticillata]
MALDASTILCMSQYNKTDIYSLLDEASNTISLYQGSPEVSFRSLGTASKQSLGEIRRPLDCYGRSVDSDFFAIMPGTKDSYPNPDINGIRIDFDNNTIPTWKFVTVSATYNEATAPKASMLYQSATYLLLARIPVGHRVKCNIDEPHRHVDVDAMTTMSMPVTMVSNMMGGPSPMVMSSLPPAPGIDMSMMSDGSGAVYMISGNQPNVDYVSATVDSRLM